MCVIKDGVYWWNDLVHACTSCNRHPSVALWPYVCASDLVHWSQMVKAVAAAAAAAVVGLL